MIGLLAETFNSSGISPEAVGVIVGGMIVTLLSGGVLGKKIADSRMQVTNNPLNVAIAKQYMTREDCAACMRENKSDLKEMKALYDKVFTLVLERDKQAEDRLKSLREDLSEKILAMGDQLHTRITQTTDEGAERRRRIHDKLNEHADLLSRMEARTEVSKSIGKLGAAIMTLAKKD